MTSLDERLEITMLYKNVMVHFPLYIKSYGCKMDVSYTFGSLLANSTLPAHSELKPSL